MSSVATPSPTPRTPARASSPAAAMSATRRLASAFARARSTALTRAVSPRAPASAPHPPAPTSTSPAPRLSSASAVDLPHAMFTTSHEVLRPRAATSAATTSTSSSSSSTSSTSSTVVLTVGLTERAFDLIGDVRAVADLAPAGASVAASAPLATLEWEGFRRTASDELYHASWANVSGARPLALPFPSDVVEANDAVVGDPYAKMTAGAEGWVAAVEVTTEALREAMRSGAVMGEREYAEMCEREEEEEDANASKSYP